LFFSQVQAASVLVVGDSHVRRMQPHSHALERLQSITVDWAFRGGATTKFAEEQVDKADGHQVVVIMLGGNDLANGMPVDTLVERLHALAYSYLRKPQVKCVVLPSVWPRGDEAFNRKAATLSEQLEIKYRGHPSITYWQWDKRQSWRNSDGVHLLDNGYRRAVRYLSSAILWAIHHRLSEP
jgi:lysophospholipase L1-like esterase